MTREDFVLVYAHSRQSGNNIYVVKDRPDWQNGRVNLPGGHVELDDPSFAHAARREFAEETGIAMGELPKYLGHITGELRPDHSYFVHCFRYDFAYDLDINPQEGETEKFFWGHWDKVKTDRRILPNLNFIVPMLRCGISNWTCIDENAGPDVRPYKVEFRYDERS